MENGPLVCNYRMVRYLSTIHVTKANFVILGGLKRYRGGLKSKPLIVLVK